MNILNMPVTPEEWESGVAYTPLANGILSFLRENSPMGYSVRDLLDKLPTIGLVHEFDGNDIPPNDVQDTLNGLIANMHVESRELRSETSLNTYYRAS